MSTDPPVLVPLLVGIYSRFFNAKYIYHLQDIHPEAAHSIRPINKFLLAILKLVDSWTMKNACLCIALSNDMEKTIFERTYGKAKTCILVNPSVDLSGLEPKARSHAFSFCGNLGRFQRVPLLIDAIQAYVMQGGTMDFVFAGGGLYSNSILELSKKFPQVTYEGKVSSKRAAEINFECTWALLPIEDDVLKYAFPSKSSTYVCTYTSILGICGLGTSLAKWIAQNNLGMTSRPNVEDLVQSFKKIEMTRMDAPNIGNREKMRMKFSIDSFVEKLAKRILKLNQ